VSDPLRTLARWPAGLEDVAAPELLQHLGGPTLVHIDGDAEPALFVSVLLHGNETSGWDGLRRLIGDTVAADRPLRRRLVVLIGNVEAAAKGVRTLPGQQDFNRIWHGVEGAEGELAAAVKQALSEQPLFAAVDLHNNTGQNPHYAVLTDLRRDNLGLAYLFDDKVVYVRQPDTVFTRWFAGRVPAVALELGPVGDARCADRAYDYLARLLELTSIPDADMARLSVFRTQARVHVPDGVAFSFAGDGLDTPLVLTGGMEAVNFHSLPTGTEFAATALPPSRALDVRDVADTPVTDEYFEVREGRLLLRHPVVPAMYTTDPLVVRQDCLCYFMSEMALEPTRLELSVDPT